MKTSYMNDSMMPEDVDTKKIEYEEISENHIGYPVLGLFENPKSKCGPSYCLISVRDNKYIALNIPAWLGKKIKDDYIESGESVSEFFNTVIEKVWSIEMGKGKNPTKGVKFGYAK